MIYLALKLPLRDLRAFVVKKTSVPSAPLW